MPLVLLAGGIGSRFGGAKQVEPVGPRGEPLGAYTACDGLHAGFDEVVLLTRPEPDIETEVLEVFTRALGAGAPLRTVPQRWPKASAAPASETEPTAGRTDAAASPPVRVRPWGTGHAVLAAASSSRGSIAVANADDAYGREALATLRRALGEAADGDAVLVTYPLRAVLSPHGGVSRGWVRAAEGERGAEVVEVHDLEARRDGSRVTGRRESGETVTLDPDTPVSMNLWGLTPAVISGLRAEWKRFLRTLGEHPAGPDRAEFQLSTALTALSRSGRIRIVACPGGSEWFGITWPDDLEAVRKAVEALHRSGAYAVPLAARGPRSGRGPTDLTPPQE